MTTTTDAVQEKIYPWIPGNELDTQSPQIGTSLLIDVRTPSEFEEVHIPDSRNIPLADLQKFLPVIQQVAKDHSVTLVCRTQNRVKMAYDELIKSGITNCRILEGGLAAWMAAGNPVIRGRHGYSLERQTRLHGWVVGDGWSCIRRDHESMVFAHPGGGRSRIVPCRAYRLLSNGPRVRQTAIESSQQ